LLRDGYWAQRKPMLPVVYGGVTTRLSDEISLDEVERIVI
jgi:hypothetical protein